MVSKEARPAGLLVRACHPVRVTPQRKTALVSVVAAAGLLTIKLVVGLVTSSLALVSEALHSGTDLVAALLTFFAVGVSGRPADPGHQYGHVKAEHLAALGEAAFLVAVCLFITWRAILRLFGYGHPFVHAKWYAFVVVAAVLVIDVSRTVVSSRAARRYRSAALASNALHFGSDFLGTSAVLVGLIGVRAGWQRSDSVAALFVAALVLAAAVRLMRRNVDVLMDRAPAEAADAARTAIARIDPPVSLRRLRMRQAAGRHFADVVIGVAPDAAVGQAHAVADAVEDAVGRAVPEADVVVHVEPLADEAEIRELALAAALNVPRVREVHNVSVLDVNGRTQISLHLKLPGDVTLEDAHGVASDVEHAIAGAVPGVESVQTHLAPLAEAGAGRNATNVAAAEAAVLRAVREETGEPPRELRFMHTDEGLVAYLTLCLDPASPLAEAHARASQIEERIRRERPEIADIIVHTEP